MFITVEIIQTFCLDLKFQGLSYSGFAYNLKLEAFDELIQLSLS